MTEEEAKTKWCPMFRSMVAIDGANREWADNRLDGSNPTCIGSRCMAWRKDGAKVKDRRGHLVDRDIDGTGQWQDTGFCGLAGKP